MGSFFKRKKLQIVMKRKKIRTDLISKQDYHKRYGIPRPTINKMIEDGKLPVEEISGTEYIIIK